MKYEEQQIDKVLKDRPNTLKGVKFFSANEQTNQLVVTDDQLREIKKILSKKAV